MNVERIFNSSAKLTIKEIFHSIIEEKIDSLIEEHYYQNKVSTTTSHVEGKSIS